MLCSIVLGNQRLPARMLEFVPHRRHRTKNAEGILPAPDMPECASQGPSLALERALRGGEILGRAVPSPSIPTLINQANHMPPTEDSHALASVQSRRGRTCLQCNFVIISLYPAEIQTLEKGGVGVAGWDAGEEGRSSVLNCLSFNALYKNFL